MQAQVKVEDGYYVVRIPVADSYSDRLTRAFLDRAKVYDILSRSQATEEQVQELADDMQSAWWRENRERFLGHANT